VVGWREVPVDHSVVGVYAKKTQPRIEQLVVKVPGLGSQEEVERELYIIRKLIEKAAMRASEGADPTFDSCAAVVAHGGVQGHAARGRRGGLLPRPRENPLYKTTFAVYHRRFSTEHHPQVAPRAAHARAGHNGEINTPAGASPPPSFTPPPPPLPPLPPLRTIVCPCLAPCPSRPCTATSLCAPTLLRQDPAAVPGARETPCLRSLGRAGQLELDGVARAHSQVPSVEGVGRRTSSLWPTSAPPTPPTWTEPQRYASLDG